MEPIFDPGIPTTPYQLALKSPGLCQLHQNSNWALLSCNSPYSFCTHTSLKRSFSQAFCTCTGSPSFTTSNSNTNYLFFAFKTLQSPALPYLSMVIQCWAVSPHFCLSYTRLPCQLVQSLPLSIFVLTYTLHTLQKWEILLGTPKPTSSPPWKACCGDSSGLRHPRSL